MIFRNFLETGICVKYTELGGDKEVILLMS